MRTTTARIYNARTGLANQLFVLIHRILAARRDRVNVLVVDDFLQEIHQMERLCPIEEILDLDHLNLLTSPLVVIGRRQWRISIEEAWYGTDRFRVLVPLLQNDDDDGFSEFEWDGNVHELVGDPAVGHRKRLDVLFRVGPYRVSCSYPEGARGRLRHPVRVRLNPSFTFRFGWINNISQPLFDYLLSGLRFRRNIVPPPLMAHPTVHVLHLRLEDDAIEHWSVFNKMTEDEYRGHLTETYKTVIRESIFSHGGGGCVLILSSLSDSPIHEFLRTEGHPLIQQEKQSGLGREEHALHDLLLAERCCNGVLIANFHMPTMKGSSFSYMLVRRCVRASHIILIDMDHILGQ